MSAEVEKPYARCLTCDLVLPTPDEARQHSQDSMEPVTGEGSVIARGHSYRIVNPTPEERAASQVRREVEDAVLRCMEDLDTMVYRGRLTVDQVREGLRDYPDFRDAWDEYVEGEGQ